jgi:hypothetical protein
MVPEHGGRVTVSLKDNLILLVTAAGLTGVLVPILNGIVGWIGRRKQEKLDRQAKVLETQAQLLEDLAALFWRYWKLALEAAYYGRQASEGSRQKFLCARERYDSQQSWEIGRNIHIAVSKAHRLIRSEGVYKDLDKLRVIVVEGIDNRLMGIEHSSHHEWDEFHHDLKDEVRQNIDSVLLRVARDLGLSAPNEEANR